MPIKRIVQSRKLLVASVGVATVLYACDRTHPPGNLMAPEPTLDAGMATSGNLVAPPPQEDAATPGPIEPVPDAAPGPETTPPGNLMPPPPPPDAGVVHPPKHHPPGNLMPPPPHPKPKP